MTRKFVTCTKNYSSNLVLVLDGLDGFDGFDGFDVFDVFDGFDGRSLIRTSMTFGAAPYLDLSTYLPSLAIVGEAVKKWIFHFT